MYIPYSKKKGTTYPKKKDFPLRDRKKFSFVVNSIKKFSKKCVKNLDISKTFCTLADELSGRLWTQKNI